MPPYKEADYRRITFIIIHILMKTFRIRTILMSLIFLVALSFASKTFASWNAYIIFTDKDGKDTKTAVTKDGSFTSSALKAGRVKVQFFWDRSSAKSATLNVIGTPGGSATAENHNAAIPIGGLGDSPQVSEITLTYQIPATREPQKGIMSGKRQYEPIITKLTDSERLLPTVNKKLGTIIIDADTEGITGKIVMKDQTGKVMAADDWVQTK